MDEYDIQMVDINTINEYYDNNWRDHMLNNEVNVPSLSVQEEINGLPQTGEE